MPDQIESARFVNTRHTESRLAREVENVQHNSYRRSRKGLKSGRIDLTRPDMVCHHASFEKTT